MRPFIAFTSLFVLLASNARAVDLGRDVERGLGEMVSEELEATYGVVDDPLLTTWVNRVGQRLAAASGRTSVRYRFKVLDSDEINAVAAPGGFIYVNRGTLAFVKSEDELAAVLGHEVGHVAGRHAMKQLNAQLLGTLVLAGFQAAKAETLRAFGSVAGSLALLKFSRDEENDADRRGVREVVATGYDGRAMLDFFRRLQTTEKEKPSSLEVYFMTHPPTEERLRRVGKEPGVSDTGANAVSLGDGYAERFLFRQAYNTYRRALERDPTGLDVRYRMADALRRLPRMAASKPLDPATRARHLQDLEAMAGEIERARQGMEEDRQRLAVSQKDIDDDLDATARSLTSASQVIRKSDSTQIRQFLRMARSFDQAARTGANLRAIHQSTRDTLNGLSRMNADLRTAVEKDDRSASSQVESLRMVLPQMLKDLADGVHRSREHASDAKSGVRSLRMSADSLLSSYRLPFGYSSGQFSILDLQVSGAQDSLREAALSTRRSLSDVSRARVLALTQRINYLTRAVSADDVTTAALIARYLGAEVSAVTQQRARVEFGDAALYVAREQVEKVPNGKKRPAVIQWENICVLFNLMANDIEKEAVSIQ